MARLVDVIRARLTQAVALIATASCPVLAVTVTASYELGRVARTSNARRLRVLRPRHHLQIVAPAGMSRVMEPQAAMVALPMSGSSL